MMLKRLSIFTILIVMALVGSVPAVTARGHLPVAPPESAPPVGQARGQALVTGSITVQQTHSFDPTGLPMEQWFPPDYAPDPGNISRFVFNARKGTKMVLNPVGIPVWEASGHLFWFKDGEVIRVDIQYMLQDWEGWWPYFEPYPRCNYISGLVYSDHDPPHYGMCFVVCDLPEPFVYVAALDAGVMYRFDVLHGSVIIKE